MCSSVCLHRPEQQRVFSGAVRGAETRTDVSYQTVEEPCAASIPLGVGGRRRPMLLVIATTTTAMSSFTVHSSVDVGRHLFVLHLHVEVLKIINVVWCQFRDFRCKVSTLASLCAR